MVQIFIERTKQDSFQPREPAIAHFQFEPRFEAQLPDWIMKAGPVSVPEITAMNAALMYFHLRGKGETFSQRRLSQLAVMEGLRRQVVSGLETVPGIKVLTGTPE